MAKAVSFWSEKTIRRTLTSLEKQTLLLTANHNTHKFDKTKWYSINYAELERLEIATNRSGQNDQTEGTERPPHHLVKMTTSYNKDNNRLPIDSHREGPVCEEMIKIWNIVIEKGNKTIELTKEREAILIKTLNDKFAKNIDLWKRYCEKIAVTPFLKGETPQSQWKATLDWALKTENIVKVQEGAYGEGAFDEKEAQVDKDHKIEMLIEEKEGSEPFKKFQKALLEKIGVQNFESWFKNVTEESFKNNILTLKAPNAFVADSIKDKYMKEMETAAREVWGAGVKVEV